MKKGTAIVLVLVLIAGMTALAYFISAGRRALLSDPYKAISPEAVVIIESPDLQSLMNQVTSGKGLAGEIEKIKEFSNFSVKAKYVTDQLNKSDFKPFLETGISLISFYHIRSEGLVPLVSVAAPAKVRYNQMKAVFRNSGITQMSETSSDGTKILVVPFSIDNSPDTLFATTASGLFLCTTSLRVLNRAILQTDSESNIMANSSFSRIHQAAGRNEDKLFIQFRNLRSFISEGFKKSADQIVNDIAKLAENFEADIYLDDNNLVLAGYAETSDSTDLLYRFKNAKAGSFHTFRILPSATVLFETLILPDSHRPARTKGTSSSAYSLAESIDQYLGEEVTRALVDPGNGSNDDNTLVIFELGDRVFAEKVFREAYSQTPESSNIQYFQPDDQVSIPVYSTSFKGFSAAFVPGMASGINDSCFVFYDNYLIAGSSFSTISRFLYDNILNKTLSNDILFREFESSLPSVASFCLYCVPSGLTGKLTGALDDRIVNILNNNLGSVARLQAIGLQLISSNQMIYSTLSVRFTPEARERSATEWETKLDTAASIKPFFFTNHTTGAREIFVQDLDNNAYLINSAGRVLWKVPLNERINGQVYSVDYFRNGKLQLLFAGRNYLHLLDRNGNYVERYPVRLRSPSSSPLALFDYDNNKDYRLLIAGEDKTVYAYDKTGSTVKGWRSFKTSGMVNTEVSWFRVAGKDFLVVSDEASVYLLDRTGNIRLNLKEPVVRARNSAVRLTPGTGQAIVLSSPDGTVQQISFDGNVTRISFKPLSADHSFDFFDVDGDGFGEYVFIDKGILYLYDHNRKEMFEKDFGSARLGAPISFTFSSGNRAIGVFDIDKKLIYLINSEGKILKGFPLRGTSMFSIGKMSDRDGWNLIVGGADNFLYNYDLNAEF